MNKSKIFLFLIILIIYFTGPLTAVKIHKYEGNGSLEAKWSWALKTGAKTYSNKGFWVGYSIKKRMREGMFYSSGGNYVIHGNHSNTRFSCQTTLAEILEGKEIVKKKYKKGDLKKVVRQILHPSNSQKKVLKDLAIMYLYEKDSSLEIPEKTRLNNLDTPFDPDKKPIFWLGDIQAVESFNFLAKQYPKMKNEKGKRSLISKIGIHPNSDQVVPFLVKILKSSDTEKVRGRAAIELGEHRTQTSLKILIQTAEKDASLYVRKRAVYGMEDLEMEEAVDALIRIAKGASHPKVRYAAIHTLGDIASKKTIETLKEIVAKNEFTDVQKRAVYALEDLPADEGVPYLIKVAKTHKKMQVRRAAIHCLGDSKDPRALQALIDIIKK